MRLLTFLVAPNDQPRLDTVARYATGTSYLSGHTRTACGERETRQPTEPNRLAGILARGMLVAHREK